MVGLVLHEFWICCQFVPSFACTLPWNVHPPCYPGCGHSFTLLVTHCPENFRRAHCLIFLNTATTSNNPNMANPPYSTQSWVSQLSQKLLLPFWPLLVLSLLFW